MRTVKMVLCACLIAFAWTACSDDDPAKPEAGAEAGPKEAGTEAAPKEAGSEAAPDATPDAAKTGTVKGTVSLAGSITCGSTAADDCKGTLIIAILDGPLPTATPIKVLPMMNQDLSGSGATVSYTVADVPVGDVYVGVQLKEDGSVGLPAPGDIVSAPPYPKVTVTDGGNITQDLTLVARFVPPGEPSGDAAPSDAGTE